MSSEEDSAPGSDLKLKEINLQIATNKRHHHTDKYISNELILRRGQPFKITLTFNRCLQSGENISFTAQTGPNPQESTNTKADFPLSTSDTRSSWRAVRRANSSKLLEINISSPSNAVIGRYRLSFKLSRRCYITSHKLGDLILIFNPWASGDSVYLENSNERDEYVLNDRGLIYSGSLTYISGFPWDYGQFEESILTACLAMLDENFKYIRDKKNDYSRRSDPVYISRVCSAMVNSNDENGVLEGKWKEPYKGGVLPNSWNGSAAIIRKWYNEKFTAVKYGQCWVFAGVLCTVLRCLGIPTRTVTNFESGHDTDVNLCIDEFVSSNAKRLGSKDSVWNFHVWNECWFTRRDLGRAYDGWQAVDATPQEISEGRYICGPASVKAIKEGDVDLSYEAPFVFAEVNADRNTWVTYADGRRYKVRNVTSAVGKFISTKAVLSGSRQDITDHYKYPEGSAKEREVFRKAHNKLFKRHGFAQEDSGTLDWLNDAAIIEFSDESDEEEAGPLLTGQLQLDGSAKIGQDVVVNMIIKNQTSENRRMQIKIRAYSLTYTRTPGQTVLKNSVTAQLSPNEEKKIPVTITYSQYGNSLTEDNMIEVSALCEDDRGQKLLLERCIIVKAPKISFKVPEKVVMKQTFKAEVLIHNPLSEVVRNCTLLLEGSGLLKQQLKISVEDLKPQEKRKIEVDITPYTLGARELLANLVCDRFTNMKGFQDVVVAQA
ncbi:protein-glutamine gamma-glutamyltransferase E-like [Ambystoma mexicanum]|uniref:protein-glutamine gamma-glutamyltransferase E-like n=1 Tax=Ambystoma mexicanum TaxID=8296 RepID=UPI0037E79258